MIDSLDLKKQKVTQVIIKYDSLLPRTFYRKYSKKIFDENYDF